MALANPVIVVPGITASNLRDEYSVEPDIVWSAVLNKGFGRITLHPDDLRYELREPARIREDSVFEMPYEELVLELRHNLTEKADEPVPVYPFAYDWRHPLERTEEQLALFVDEVIHRTKLLRHYDKDEWSDDPKVDLVGHSMGGLVISGYLQAQGGEAPIGKVATLGTPFQGSYEAALKILTGTASLPPLEPTSREREAARLTPALYYLLPSFRGAVVDEETGENVDLFDVESWQKGVLETLAEFYRMYGLEKGNVGERMARAKDLLASLLANAKRHRARVGKLDLSSGGLDASDWLAIVGVDSKTRIGLEVTRKGGKPRFDLSSEKRVNAWGQEDGPRHLTGDGTVPFRGAQPRFLPVESLVCLSPDDLGYWELADRVLIHPVGWHGLLPKCNVIHRLIVKHFKGERADGSVWGRPAPGVARGDWKPPLRNLRAK